MSAIGIVSRFEMVQSDEGPCLLLTMVDGSMAAAPISTAVADGVASLFSPHLSDAGASALVTRILSSGKARSVCFEGTPLGVLIDCYAFSVKAAAGGAAMAAAKAAAR